ncbi:MAG: hypothetical protein QM715_15410 [Nibricoccus sp.]
MPLTATVVLDESCAHLQEAVARFAAVRVFKRSTGFHCDSKAAATELHQLLVDENLHGRAVYVAPSFAGFTALLHAGQYPGALAAVLLLDPSHPRQGDEAIAILESAPPSSERECLTLFFSGFGPAWVRSCREVAKLKYIGKTQLHVFAAGRFDLSTRLPQNIQSRLLCSRHSLLREYCNLTSTAVFKIIENTGHDIARLAPNVVLAEIHQIAKGIEATANLKSAF